MKRWTATEDGYLVEHYDGNNAQAVAEALGRSADAVISRMCVLRKKYGVVNRIPDKTEKDRNVCRGCIFRQNMSGYSACHYMLYTGKRRPCEPERCTVRDTNPAHLAEYLRRLKNGNYQEENGGGNAYE